MNGELSGEVRQSLEFGPFQIDPTKRVLLRAGVPQVLTPKAFDILTVLIQHSGEVVDKDELMRAVWPDTVVEENNLTRNISSLRKALGEGPRDHQYVVTVPGRGYSFVADVRRVPLESSNVFLARFSKTRLVIEENDVADAPKPRQILHVLSHSAIAVWRNAATRHKSIALALLLAALITGLVLLSYSTRSTPNNPSVKAIAVLPFRTLGPTNETDQYLGLGMADALITRMSNASQIVIRPTSAVREYETASQDVSAIGRKLSVDAVLEGTVQRVDDRIRVTVQLVDVRNGRPLWGEKFDETFNDIFAVQDAIAERTVAALALELTPQEREFLRKRYTDNPQAYQAYLKGRYFWDRRGRPGEVAKAQEYLDAAIKHDPNYGPAYAALAEIYLYEGSDSSARAKAEAATVRALQIDESLPEAHATLGLIRTYEWDWPRAETELKRAIELNPNYAMAHLWYATHLRRMGLHQASETQYRRALELDPVSVVVNTSVGVHFWIGRQYDRAIDQYRKALEIDPNSLWPRLRLGQALGTRGHYREALIEYQKAIALLSDAQPNKNAVPNPAEIRLAQLHAFSGQKAEALAILNRWKQGSEYDVALIHIGLGNQNAAFALLEKAYELRDPHLPDLKDDPRLDEVREDPRYRDLMGRVGLTP